MDRKAAALGRKLAKGLETEEEEEEEEEDFYDVSDMEVSGIVFSPVKRYLWLCSSCMVCGVGGASSWGDCWGQSCISWHFASIKYQKISVFPNRSRSALDLLILGLRGCYLLGFQVASLGGV